MMYQAGKIGAFYKMDLEKAGKGWFEMGPIRPPSEGRDCSLLLRVTRNCPWNRCEFCRTYKNERYSARSVEEVKADIDLIWILSEELKSASWQLGFGGTIAQEVVAAIINGNPELYSRQCVSDEEVLHNRLHCLVSMANWLYTGGKTVFLQDANTPQMHTPALIEILTYLKGKFSSVERVTSYARAKTIARKTLEEMQQLEAYGLSRLHIGLESGCDEVLAAVKKGVTAEEHIIAGRKIKEAEITLSEYMMPGLGGRKWSTKHALDSAHVLNEIDADFIRLRSFVPRQSSPMYDRVLSGEFEVLSEDEVVAEIGLFVENLNCNSYLVSDQMCNLLGEIEGQLPRDKSAILKTIADYLQKPLHERLRMQLDRRLAAYMGVYGGLNEHLALKVRLAVDALEKKAPETEQRVKDVLDAVKPAFI
jgi:radical SAM superfamily enzyme YgiQ (UPF0313 family)